MNPEAYEAIRRYRIRSGPMASTDAMKNNGAWFIRTPLKKSTLNVIASDAKGWDHVSVSLPNRVPNWAEMCFIKRLFWLPDECVMQLHPPERLYVNNHRYTLHLWRPQQEAIPMPPIIMV
jgi:hypothetical protein